MCGRYASASGRPELLDLFGADDETGEDALPPSWNVAPTDPVPAVLRRRRSSEGEGETHTQLRVVRWGLVPSWAKDPSIGARMINARRETLDSKPAFRSALARRRCLLPADGYYEWYAAEPDPASRSKKPRKQPVYLSRSDGGLLVMAGLYEIWRDGDGPLLWSATVVTGDAIDELGHIHDRSPVLLTDLSAWLDPALTDTDAALALLRPLEPGELQARAVSMAVNSVAHNGPELLEPLAPEDVPAPVDLDAPGLF